MIENKNIEYRDLLFDMFKNIYYGVGMVTTPGVL